MQPTGKQFFPDGIFLILLRPTLTEHNVLQKTVGGQNHEIFNSNSSLNCGNKIHRSTNDKQSSRESSKTTKNRNVPIGTKVSFLSLRGCKRIPFCRKDQVIPFKNYSIGPMNPLGGLMRPIG